MTIEQLAEMIHDFQKEHGWKIYNPHTDVYALDMMGCNMDGDTVRKEFVIDWCLKHNINFTV